MTHNLRMVLPLTIMLLAAAFVPAVVHAFVSPVTITPSSADTTAKRDHHDPNSVITNYGGDTFVEALRNNAENDQYYAFVMFDVSSSVPSGANIVSASLELYDTEGQGGDSMTIYVYRVDSNWVETTLTWNTNPTIESTPTASATYNPSNTGYHSWDVTNDVKAFVSGSANNYGWCLTISDGGWVTFASKEGNSNQYPKLVVTWTHAGATIVRLDWTNPMAVFDVVVSDDGYYMAAVNNTGLYYFGISSSEPLWWFASDAIFFRSVAMSADGEYVVAGDSNGYIHYFNRSTTRTGNQTTPTWESIDMGGSVDRGTLDMSANGNYTVVGGTGYNVYYYAGCTTMTGTSQPPAWGHWVPVADFLAVHMSSDGRYVAGGGSQGSGMGFVVFYKDCNMQPYPTGYTWFARNSTSNSITDLALSDDGYGVATIEQASGMLHYWTNATSLTGDPNATWTNLGTFGSVDMSTDGDDVVAGSGALESLHFWSNGRTRQGTQMEDWIRANSTNVRDVAISHDGTTIALPADTQTPEYYALFYKFDGSLIGNYSLLDYGSMVSMSGDGNTVAIAGLGFDSLNLFTVSTDTTPPAINDVYQQPAKDNVHPEDEVKVFANITDAESGVENVFLNFTSGNGTWFAKPMESFEQDIWNTTIPAYPYGTNVTYVIIAEDSAGNVATSEISYTLEYQVVPEHWIMLFAPLLVIAAALVLALRKRRPAYLHY